MQVTEAPEMAGLPPVTGNIRVTVQKVEEPDLPDPPPPLPALSPTNPAVIARIAELRESYKGTKMLFLSATVYDHSRTLLRIYPNGKIEGEIRAWSNMDFNHFSGFSTYRVTDDTGKFHDVGLLMGIGNTIFKRENSKLARHGRDDFWSEIPELPDLSVKGPTYLVVDGQIEGEAMNTLTQIHDLYRKEGTRMESAYLAREKAQQERKAYLLANPPVPEDVKVRFWKRRNNSPQATEEGTSGR